MSTKSPADAPPAQRGRPRSERSQLATVEAAAELLLEKGLAGMSVAAVADRAGVSTATIYRWWASKELLALDALLFLWREHVPVPGEPDTGSLRKDLYARVKLWTEVAQPAFTRAIAGLVAKARCDAEFGQLYVERFVEQRVAAARPLIVRAIGRGDIPADTDVAAALDMIYGPIYHRLLHGHEPVTARYLKDVVDTVVDGLESRVTRA